MSKLEIPFIVAIMLLSSSMSLASFSVDEIKTYCDSMALDGLAEEDAKNLVDQCRDEYSAYDSSDETVDVDCYEEAGLKFDESASESVSYDELLQQCFNANR